MKPILIIGNGKSTGQIDWEWLKKKKHIIDTFGMNNAYKMYEKLDFFPTYYACLDNIVIQSHKDKIQQLMMLNKIKKLFLHGICQFEPHSSYQCVNKLKQKHGDFFIENSLSDSFSEFDSWMNTGSDAVQISIMLGYTKIYIIGVDGYQSFSESDKNISGIIYEVTKTPTENSNYWFNEYLETGDQYNAPPAISPGWTKALLVCTKRKIELINLSLKSQYDFMPKSSYVDFVKEINKSYKML